MGFSGLARWINAPSSGLDLVSENIANNYNGQTIGKWQLSVRSYRSTLSTIPGFDIPAERTMAALTMGENVFVLLEDPLAPTRADLLAHIATLDPSQPGPDPDHYRSTFLTLRPPGALEQLLTQLKGKWVPSRQSGADSSQRGSSGSHVRIEGRVWHIGSDWVVRAGTVHLGGGTHSTKGMLLEAEYKPLPVLHSQTADSASELLSNLLTAILPNVRDAKVVAVTISESQWEEVLWDREQEQDGQVEDKDEEIVDDIFVSGDRDMPAARKGDWIGLERDRRSAFLIIGALKSEGIC
ncbi:hypothetical protein NEOLEDRAFT_1134842 [Neolentinus lepideus HHB14362 ss-1]|uniref:Mediator complex subunit 20 n=1 Tax=Neolentinus lepideus HHB14362 ss-1 TaxID=1314782 RepID=A0A165RZK2_9AGAM|nr:hypothetical protein NEOLEDRAFT_1134842 [Neolentinus lepideus HHB14362 ss-1]